MEKILTIIVPCRNDNYKGNYKNRLESTINYNCKFINDLGYKNKFQIEEKSQNENLNIIDLGNLPDWNWLININYKRVLFSPSKYVYHLIKFFRLIVRKI